ncbi:MAG: FimV/HubP family polar landmark protein, partial [Pseudomonadota bacterium]
TPDKKVVETEAVKDRKERQSLAERVASLEESVISRQIHAKDLSDKIGAVRAQLKREKRLMELESQRLAEATRKPEPVVAPETKKPDVKAEDKPKPESKPEAKPAAKPEDKAETKPATPATPVKEEAKPVEVRKAAPPRRAAPPPEPAKEEKGFVAEMMDTVLGSDLMPVFLGGVVLVSGLIAVIYLRRRRRAIGEFEESILSADGSTDQPAMTTDTSGQAVPAGDTSFLSDFSQGGMGTTHTDEVDPVAEAEVYLAYGRDETAEEILKDAIVKNPERNELKVKLLEIYHQRNDARGFETLAEELYAALGGRGGKLWEKVEGMGRKLNPDNPLFRGGAPAGGGKPAAKAGARTMPGFNDTSRSMSSPGFTTPMGGDTGTVGHTKTSAGQAPAPGSETSIDFDIGMGGPASGESMSEMVRSGGSAAPAPEPTGVGSPDTGLEDIDLGQATPSGNNSIDFDMGASTPESSAPMQSAAPADGGLDFDFGAAADMGSDVAVAEQPAAGGEGGSAQWDETATKLDLAKAYIDMGDAEGARSILDEVMA